MSDKTRPSPIVDPRAFFDVVFDGPPSSVTGRFVETEDRAGASFRAGEWVDRGGGLWALRVPAGTGASVAELLTVCVARANEEIRQVYDVSANGPSDALGDELGAIVREFKESITHMEDAITRFNKGVYRRKGAFAITDAERS